MRSRRELLHALFASLVIALAGCTGDESSGDGGDGTTEDDTPNEEGTPEPLSVGEPVTYGGLKISVTSVRTATEYTDDRGTHTPKTGATFLLVHIRMKNVGDTEIRYPERGDDIELIYKGEEASHEFPSKPFNVGGETLTLYSDSVEEQGADTGAYPDTVVKGWAVFEIPKEFDTSDAFVTIRHRGTSTGRRMYRWQVG